MDKAAINYRLQLMVKYLQKLRQFESISLEDYLNSFDQQLITERLLQLIIEAASDINSSLLVQVHEITPASYFDSFIEAGKQGIMSPELAADLAQSAGLRNRLVHQYESLDNRVVFAAISLALEKYAIYVRQISNYLDSLEVNNG